MSQKKIFVVYNKEDRENINKLISDFKNIGIITIRQELVAGNNKFDFKYKNKLGNNDYVLFYVTDNFIKTSKCEKLLNLIKKDPIYNNRIIYLCNDKNTEVDVLDNMSECYKISDVYNDNYIQVFKKMDFNNVDELKLLSIAKDELDLEKRDILLEDIKEKFGETKNYKILKANTLYRQKNFENARNMLDNVLTIESNDPLENYEHAVILEDYYNNVTKAIQYYEKTIELDDSYKEAYYNAAILYFKYKIDFNKAEVYYKKVIELDDKDANAYYNLAILEKTIKDNTDEAKKLYKKVIELDPNNSKAYNNLANIYVFHEQDYKKGEDYLEKALKVNPYDGQVLFNYANILCKFSKDYDKAVEMYKRSIRCVDSIYARVNLALVLEEQFKDYKGALENYERCLELQPNEIRVILKIANLYEEAFANNKKAIEFFELANKIKKDDPFILDNIKRLKNI